MKWLFSVLLAVAGNLYGQEPDQVRLMEDQADVEDVKEVEEDLVQWQGYKARPLNLNRATAEELSVFSFLTAIQIGQLIRYRTLAGDLLHVLELQAVPGWEPEIIRRILPYITVAVDPDLRRTFSESLRRGTHMFLFRSSLSARSGFLARYHFTSPRLQWGLNTEKDAGERYWQKDKGLAFLSAHAALRNMGIVRQLVIGDYIINMGQGLMLWQGRAVRKTAMPLGVKRQLPFLQPYRSNDENRYFRGAAVHLQHKRIEAGLFVSANRLDANRKQDSVTGLVYVSSFLNSGYHRTPDELADKNVLGYVAAGGMLAYQDRSWRIAANLVSHRFSLPVLRAGELYNLFAAKGEALTNYGLQYHKTWRNMHLFGELSMDKDGDPACLQGLMMSADPGFDISLVARKIGRGYRAFQGNAFTESSEPSNEEGIYLGASWRVTPSLVVDAYADHYRFPWLRYRMDAPGWGVDRLLQISFRPDKKAMIYLRYRVEEKTGPGSVGPMSSMELNRKEMGRLQVEFRPGLEWEWRFRVEVNALLNSDQIREFGFLTSTDLFWSPLYKPFKINGRLMIYDTNGYASRIYSFENDVLFYNIVPAFYGRGARIYVNTNIKLPGHFQLFLKLMRSFNRFSGGWSTRFQIMKQI